MPDKLNTVDYHWFLVCTKPGHEPDLCSLIEREKGKIGNILEVYCPTHTKVYVRRGDNEQRLPFFDGYVFVLATQGALVEFLRDNDSDAYIWYNRKRTPDEKAVACTIPESQIRAFRDYNENYADKVIVLERPYTDYAINAKTDEPNEIVRVVDGPLAGCEGYICRFHRKKGLVFRVQGIMPGSWLTVTYPNASDLHVVRLHNAERDRLSIGTEKGRAADLLVGILQSCGYGERTHSLFYELMERLAADLSLEALCKHLQKQGEKALADRLAKLTTQEAELLINLARYEHDTPGYVKENWPRMILRPFLTPTSGVELEADKNELELQHKDYTEFIRKVDISEEVYYPSRQEDGKTVIMQSVILCVALLINSYYSILFSSNATHKSHRLFKKSMRFLSSVQSGYSVLSFIGKASSRINLLAFTSKRAYISVVLTDTCPSQSRMIIML